MKFDKFGRQIDALRKRFTEVQQDNDSELGLSQQNLQSAFEEISTALEELQVAEVELHQQNEELCQQNEELMAARVATERETQRYQDLFEEAPEGYLVVSASGVIQEVNCAAAKLLNVRQKYLVGKPLVIFFSEEVRPVLLDKLTQLRQVDQVQDWEVRLIPRSGKPIEAAVRMTVIQGQKSKPSALRVCVRDITERKLAQEALQESEERFRLMADTAPVLIWMSGSDKLCNYFNQGWLEFTGRTLEQEIVNGWTFGVHPDDLQDCLNIYTTAFNARQSFSMEYRLKRFDSEYRWILASGTPRFNRDGSFAGYIGSAIDITERKQGEEQLRLANKFEATLKRITDKVRDSLDEHQILQTAVQELALVLGIICCDTALYNLDESTSTICYAYTASNGEETLKTPSSVGRVVQMTDVPEVYRQLLQGQYFQFCDLTLDPIRSQVAVLSCPIVDDRRVLGDLWLFNYKSDAFDELEIRLVQQVANQCAIALRQARLYQAATTQVKELEKLNALKDDFLSTVSHELRTPITNMKMALSMLKVAPTSEKRERYLEILQAECNRESQLINDLLDLQQLEVGSNPNLLDERVSLQEILSGVIEPFQVRTQQRQQSLQINFPSELPMLACRRASLKRILAELLNNACKYTPARGEIILSVCHKNSGLLPLPADSALATIFTISNSVEIPAAELPRLFGKFYRVPNADRWQQGGTGLGLALVQKLVEQLQGTIEVESSKGWTTFTIQLPNLLKV